MQSLFTHFMQAAEWLSAVAAPVAVATSLIPTELWGSNPIWSWIIIYFSIVLMQIYYSILLGVMAGAIAGAQAETINDLAFPFVLGVFAPVIAFEMSRQGALAAIRAVGSTGGQVAQAGISIGASIATSLISAVGRFFF